MNKKNFLFFLVLKLILIFPIIGYSFEYFANISGTPAIDSNGTIYAVITKNEEFLNEDNLVSKLIMQEIMFNNE